jgi:hypothetical protein
MCSERNKNCYWPLAWCLVGVLTGILVEGDRDKESVKF